MMSALLYPLHTTIHPFASRQTSWMCSLCAALTLLCVLDLCRFVTFSNDASVDACFQHGTMHLIAGKQVEVKSATPRGVSPMPGMYPVDLLGLLCGQVYT